MRWAGRAIDDSFRVIAVVLALLTVIVGDLITVLLVVSRSYDVSLWALAREIRLAQVPVIVSESTGVMELLFWLIAAYAAYRLGARRVTALEIVDPEYRAD